MGLTLESCACRVGEEEARRQFTCELSAQRSAEPILEEPCVCLPFQPDGIQRSGPPFHDGAILVDVFHRLPGKSCGREDLNLHGISPTGT